MNHTIKQTITDQQIDDLICTAFEGGISYWAGGKVQVKDDDYKGATWAHEVITRGGTVFVLDEDGKKYALTLAKVLKALGQKKGLDIEDYDAGDADEVVQLALFGEVVYG